MPTDKIFELCFETHPKITADKFEMVGSDTIGKIKIPKLGCLTPNELLAWERYILKTNIKETSYGEIKIDIVTLMLQSRINQEWTKESTINLTSYTLVEALFRFFENERRNWEPEWELKLEGVGAEKLAIQYARDIKGAVFYRDDIPLTYLVVKEYTSINFIAWKVLEDYRVIKSVPNSMGK